MPLINKKVAKNNSDVYLPPEISNPEMTNASKSRRLSAWRKVLRYIRISFPHLRHKPAGYSPLINENDSRDQFTKKLGQRTVTPYIENLPITVMPFEEIPPPSDYEEKKQMAIEAAIAAYPYHCSTEKIAESGNIAPVSATPPRWKPLTELVDELAKKTGLTHNKKEGFLCDKKTGFTAYLLQQPETKEIRLVFGGTSSGLHAGGLLKRSLVANPEFTLQQWRSNIRNALGLRSPENFNQAKELTKELQALLKASEYYQGAHLVLSGHSKGGAEAIYAALSHNPPLEARVFSSAELHQQLVNQIPVENLKQACQKVVCVNIKGDFVPNMRKFLPTKLRALGSCINLNPAHQYNIERHDSFMRHIRYFAEQG